MNLLKSTNHFPHLISVCSQNNYCMSELLRRFSSVCASKFHSQKFALNPYRLDSFRREKSFQSCIKKTHFLINFYSLRRFTIETFIDEKTYEAIADQTLDLLTEKLEDIVEKLDPNISDIVFNNGVITLSLGSKGTFVINKQTPNRQIWLSSPLSGPKRYDYMDGQWIYKHNGQSIEQLLKTELEELYETSVDL